MKLSEKLRNYIVKIVKEESEELAENVRNLNATVAGYEAVTENVRNLNAAVTGYETVAENVRNLNAAVAGYEAIAENVRNLNALLDGYEALTENVRNLNATVAGYEAVAENVRNLNALLDGYEAIAENVRNLNAQLNGYEALTENVRNLNALVAGYEAVAENVRNLNAQFDSTIEMQKVKLAMLEKKINNQHSCSTASERNASKTEQVASALAEDVYSGIDYFDFENHFRGSKEQIKRNQQQYIKYFQDKNNIIDLGCGRGEFLELLKENDIEAKGVDLYEEFVELCRMHGLDVTCDDALHFLNTQQKTGGIFAGQLIEHLSTKQLVELCRLAYEKLEEGACVIMETPNPTCLAIYSQAFYIDPSHNRPVHPLTIKYILEKSGFSDIEIIYTDTSKRPVNIPPIKGVDGEDQFNDVMHMVSELLFGSQDYAVIARKHDRE